MKIELDCPFDSLFLLFESKSVSTGMTKKVPGDAFITLGNFPVQQRNIQNAVEPFVRVIVSDLHEISVGIFSAWLYETLKKSKFQRLKVHGKEIPNSKDKILNAIKNNNTN